MFIPVYLLYLIPSLIIYLLCTILVYIKLKDNFDDSFDNNVIIYIAILLSPITLLIKAYYVLIVDKWD